MSEWPKFESRDEFEWVLPELERIARNYSEGAWRRGVDGHEVFSEMLCRIDKYWDRIPKAVGQHTYLHKIYLSCLVNVGKRTTRQRERETSLYNETKQRSPAKREPEQIRFINQEEGGRFFALEVPLCHKLGFELFVARELYRVHVKDLMSLYDCCENTIRKHINKFKDYVRTQHPDLRDLLPDA